MKSIHSKPNLKKVCGLRDIFSFTVLNLRRRDPEEDGGEGVAQLGHAEEDLRKVKEQRVASLIWLVFICISRLTKSAKKEAEDWARQTKRTLVMELIKQRKHTWISSLDKRMRQVRVEV